MDQGQAKKKIRFFKNFFTKKFRSCSFNEFFPNMIISGPPGVGKTSTIKSLIISKNFQNKNIEVKFLNVSEKSGVGFIRQDLKGFLYKKGVGTNYNQLKTVIIDEADSLTDIAQNSLRRIIEKTSHFARFILICNFPFKIIEAIQSRCVVFKFQKLNFSSMLEFSIYLLEKYQILFDISTIENISYFSNGDMRISSTLIRFFKDKYHSYGFSNLGNYGNQIILHYLYLVIKDIKDGNLRISLDKIIDLLNSKINKLDSLPNFFYLLFRNVHLNPGDSFNLFFNFSKLFFLITNQKIRVFHFWRILDLFAKKLNRF